jgi:hypothetical protein
MRIALAILTTIVFSASSAVCAAQSPASGTPPRYALPAPPSVSSSVSALLQPSLDTVRRTLDALHAEKWKKGSIRDEANQNIDAIQRDLETNMPPLLRDADAVPGSLSKTLPLSRHVNAIYDVLLRVVEAARVIAPDDQAAQLQQALTSMGNARLALGDRMHGSADALEKQVVDLRASIQAEAARSLAAPVPAAVPCVPPAPHRTTKKTAKPTPKKPAATAATPSPSNPPK